jgi:hypothetical protein
MNRCFEHWSGRLGGRKHELLPGGRAYRCRCGRPVFFRNSACLACGTPLGYDSGLARIVPLDPGPVPGSWRSAAPDASADAPLVLRCANYDSPVGCNWLVPFEADGRPPAQRLCVACRLNRTIPDLSWPENVEHWRRIEVAKRRLVSQLILLGLPVASRFEDPERGLVFDFLRSPPEGPRVMTGHDAGLITLDIDEADDTHRETLRSRMHEPYRTLLGHLRHEVGHYYWMRLVDGTPLVDDFRALFGDERVDYAEALQRHYRDGAPPDWALRHVSAYAASHPWEDWAETWAHYLHMVDVVDTALSFDIDPRQAGIEAEPFGAQALWRAGAPDSQPFLDFVNAWAGLTAALNELSRSMGQPDFYPFVLPAAAVAKLQFIHCTVGAAS